MAESSDYDFDMLVMGSGPAGQRAAIQAAKLGKRVAVIEHKAVVGGACTNTGTIPSKTLREAVSEGQDVLTPDLRQALDNAVSALQFPDMATQLIDHVVQRIALLEKITQALGCSPQLSAGEFTAVLAAVACEWKKKSEGVLT